MKISLNDVLKVIRRFKREAQFNTACFMLEMTFHLEGPRAAMAHARRIAAAYAAVRDARISERESRLRADAVRRGLVVAW